MTIRDSLAQVQELLGRATPGPWCWSMNGNIVTDPYTDDCEIAAVYSEHMDDIGIPANASAIIAAVNWLREHGSELMKMLDRHGAGDAEDAARYRWIVRRPMSKITIGSQWGEQRISFTTTDADSFIDSAREDAARAGERG